MRYLLNAVAADGTRFDDLKERFAFVGTSSPDPVALEDWTGRGITPIHYDSTGGHAAILNTLQRWADLSAINGKPRSSTAKYGALYGLQGLSPLRLTAISLTTLSDAATTTSESG